MNMPRFPFVFLFVFLASAVLSFAHPTAAGADEIYKVRKGDNLSRIAKKFRVKPVAIMEANRLDSDRLMPGERLTIPTSQAKAGKKSGKTADDMRVADRSAMADEPAKETFLHEVEKGETLTSIADTYDMSVKDLKSLNRIRRSKKLKAGSKILVYRIPEGDPEETISPIDSFHETRLERELKELIESPVAKEVNDPADPAKASAAGGIKEKLVRIAQKLIDIPYRFGGNTFKGIDCSGYVQKVFGMLDFVLPRTAREQFKHGEKVDKDDLAAGDLVFFRTYAKYPSHVGIYLGNNEFIHASSKERRVKIDSLDAPYYYKRFLGARRLPLDDQSNEI